MQDKVTERQKNGDESNGRRMDSTERAYFDNEWRNRPLWRAVCRPDSEWGPSLTRAAFQLLNGEDHDTADNSR